MVQLKKRRWLWAFPLLLVICLLTTAISFLINLTLPRTSPIVETLSALEKARIEESFHLRAEMGDQVFPRFGKVNLAQVVYNEKYAFLLNQHNPADGWYTLPSENLKGQAWSLVSDDYWNGLSFYRQELKNNITPQAFAVRIGDTYAGSLTTLDWMRINLMDQIRQDLPGFLKPIFPYHFVTNIFISSSDMYISLLEHESFHAFQAAWAPQRFYPAEKSRSLDTQYPWFEEQTISAWETELKLLQSALRSSDPEETHQLAEQFLTQREERRTAMGLSQNLIDFENNREWVEGMARYAELEIWRLASERNRYQPVLSIQMDASFYHYRKFNTRWKRELDQMPRMAKDEGDGRFYYSGMAQAYLLDQLQPDWKSLMYEDPSLNLEDLLRNAVNNPEL